VGIELCSVADNLKSAGERIAYIIETYRQPALVEEFIIGRELNVSLWGNAPLEVMPVTEQDYSQISDPLQRLLPYDSKWVMDSFYFNHIPAVCPADLSPQDLQVVRQTARRAFESIGLRDYGRVDIRLRDGVPMVIDINDIPDFSPSSGFPFTAKAAGFEYPDMVQRLLDIGLQRIGWK